MSTFIDILFSNGDGSSTIPFRCTNHDWQISRVTPSIVKYESCPVRQHSVLDKIYFTKESDILTLWILGEVYSYKNYRLAGGRPQLLDTIFADMAAGNFDPVLTNGNFAIIVYNKHKREWRVYTNRLGTYHLYYGSLNGQFVLGTFFKSIASSLHSPKINLEGLLEYFGFGFFLGDNTFFKDIVILKPASVYIFDEELRKKEHINYWKPVHNPTYKDYNLLLDEFASCIQEVTIDQTAFGRVAIPISGGLDSRTMAGVCTLPGFTKKEYWGYSYGYSNDSIEISIARKIAKARQIPFTGKVTGNYLFEKMDMVADSVEFFQYIDGTRQADIAEDLKHNADFVIAAHWGDVWFDSMGVNASAGADLSAFGLKKFLKKGSGWLIKNLLGIDEEEAKAKLKQRLDYLLSQYDNIEDQDFKIKMLKTFNWSFRWTLASIRMFQPGAFPRLPFYDNRIVDFFSEVPTSLLVERKLQVDYLKKYHPDLSAVTWQEYGSNLYRYPYFNNRMLPYRVISKLGRIAKGTRTITRNWEVFYLNKEGRKNLEANILHNNKLHEFVPVESLRDLIKQFYAKPDGANGYSISMLHTFSVFLKKYFNN